ncbi:MAG: Calx-beta domain-containing protein, partial [Acidimicrobiia bacterium]|nr:Calx-beta domain-containing protein [Acidimicrobiia bacterium]
PPVLTIDDQSVAEDVAGGLMTFTVTRTGPTEVAATVLFSTADDTATAPSDYTAITDQLVTIPAGGATGTDTVDVTIIDDGIDELDTETFDAVLSTPTDATLGAASTGEGTILDDDGAPVLAIDDVSVSEGGTATFTVTKVGTTALTVTVTATTSDLTATAPGDYDSKTAPVTILAAESSKTFTVDTNEDSIDEDDEDFRVTLSAPVNATIGDPTGDGTITDDDARPVLTVADVVVAEDDGTATFTVVRTGLTERIVTVTAQTSDDTAEAGLDYVANIETLTISPGGATGSDTFVVDITEDFLVEATERFDVTLSGETNSTISDGTAVGSITDNDTAGVTITESEGTTAVIEGGATDTYDVVLTAQPMADVTVNVIPNAQVTVSATALTFTDSNWDDPQTVTVAAVEDGIDEVDPHPGLIEHTTTSTDSDFAGLIVADVVPSIGDADSLLVTIEGPTFGAPGKASTFMAMVNAGGTGTITYDWTVFFDGVPVPGVDGDAATFQFTPTEGGEYIISAIVGDDQGQNPAEFIFFTALGDIGTSVFVDDIIWLAEEGITRGCNPPDNDQFCPDKTVTRGQMAAFLVRFLGLTAIDPTIEFTDTGGNIFEQDILKLATAGITRGCNAEGTRFCPDNGVTRGQMAAFLVRAFGLEDNGGGDLFTDDDLSIFEDDIDKLATAGITRGCNPPTNDNFCPDKTVTRGQMAAFLRRAEPLI